MPFLQSVVQVNVEGKMALGLVALYSIPLLGLVLVALHENLNGSQLHACQPIRVVYISLP